MALPDYQEFNKFQTLFYTDINQFSQYTHYEINKHAFTLLNNLIKGFPHQAIEVLDTYSPNVKAIQSPSIIIALQRKFVNNFSRARVPQHVYYKSLKPKPELKVRVKKVKKGTNIVEYMIFDNETAFQIKSILKIDDKTYQYLKNSDRIQKLGKLILSEEILKEEKLLENI